MLENGEYVEDPRMDRMGQVERDFGEADLFWPLEALTVLSLASWKPSTRDSRDLISSFSCNLFEFCLVYLRISKSTYY